MEDKIYQILKKHRLPIKKREELMPDLVELFSEVGQSKSFYCHECGGSGGGVTDNGWEQCGWCVSNTPKK